MPPAVPTDVVADDLVGVYGRAQQRLAGIVGDGLRRGLNPLRAYTPDARRGDATLKYRARQLVQAQQILDDVRRTSAAEAPQAARRAYRATLQAVDRVTIGQGATIAPAFGTVHTGAVDALASNMTRSLDEAVRRAGDNVAAVFERADRIEGALRHGRSPGPVPFIGRRINDPYRAAALEAVAQGVIGLDTRRQVSELLIRDLLNEGVTDALTGFVDRSGRRWPLATYAEMVARTTTREATSRATVNRLTESGLGIVQISSHPHKADDCTPYDGKTFALNTTAAADAGLSVLDRMPPFHPRCEHVIAPGRGNLEAFERELAAAAEQQQAAAVPEPISEARPERPLYDRAEDTLRVAPLAKKDVDPALELIDRVHAVPSDLSDDVGIGKKLGVTSNSIGPGVAGIYKYSHQYGPAGLTVSPAGRGTTEKAATLVHELGHFFDHAALDATRLEDHTSFASTDDPDLEQWRGVVDATASVSNLRRTRESGTEPELNDVLDYLLDRREVFARAYNQWIATRAGDRAMLRSIQARELRGRPIHWTDEDFKPVADALDEAFRRKGLLK